MAEKKKETQYALAKKSIYSTNIYEIFIKPFPYTKHWPMWHKIVFYRNSYNQYFDSKTIMKNLKYFQFLVIGILC